MEDGRSEDALDRSTSAGARAAELAVLRLRLTAGEALTGADLTLAAERAAASRTMAGTAHHRAATAHHRAAAAHLATADRLDESGSTAQADEHRRAADADLAGEVDDDAAYAAARAAEPAPTTVARKHDDVDGGTTEETPHGPS